MVDWTACDDVGSFFQKKGRDRRWDFHCLLSNDVSMQWQRTVKNISPVSIQRVSKIGRSNLLESLLGRVVDVLLI